MSIHAPRGTGTPSPQTPRATQDGTAAPSLQDAGNGDFIRRGMEGDSVREMQTLLRQAGHDPGVVDGEFGPRTEQALRAFQRQQGITADGVVGPQTVGALRNPREANAVEARPATEQRRDAIRTAGGDATVAAPTQQAVASHEGPRAGDLQRADAQRRQQEAGAATRITGQVPVNADADTRLRAFQDAGVQHARGELAATGGDPNALGRGSNQETTANNSGPRIDGYARNAGMSPGGEWCGYFAGNSLTEGARANGAEFTGRTRLHSYQKARDYFLYRNYTDNSRGEQQRNTTLRSQHAEQGSERRYMTFEGSAGDRYATQRQSPHEVFTNPRDLPIRPGDTALFARGHIGMVDGYNAETGILTTIEGNAGGGAIHRKQYDLNDPAVRAQFDGFGRPAAGDYRPR